MQVTCSNCQSKIRVPDSAAGKKGKCPKCGTVIAIPALETPAEVPQPTTAPSSGSPIEIDESAPPRKGSRSDDDDEAVEERSPRRTSNARADDDEAGDADDGNDVRRSRQVESKGLSLASMICGIVSVVFVTVGTCCCSFIPFVGPLAQLAVVLITAVAAIVLGFIGKSKGAMGFAITGIICGAVSLLLLVIGVVLVIILFGANILIAGAAGR